MRYPRIRESIQTVDQTRDVTKRFNANRSSCESRTPVDATTRIRERFLRSGLETRYERAQCVIRFQPQQQHDPIRSGADCHGLDIEAAAQGNELYFDGSPKITRHQR